MTIPPPPPPGPPPPPMFVAGGGGGGDKQRSALLSSIQSGTKLKKTVTVDKSGPLIAGKIGGAGGGSTGGLKSSTAGNNVSNGGTPKLGGIFGGMSAMPVLKPVGSRGVGGGGGQNINKKRPVETNEQSNGPISNGVGTGRGTGGGGGGMDLNAELMKNFTLKSNKSQHQTNENQTKINRGPPPQPPPIQKNLPSSTSDSILGKSNLTIKNSVSASSPSLNDGNTSTLFRKNQQNSSSSISTITNGSTATMSQATSISSSIGSTSSLSITSNQQQLLPNKSTLFNTNTNNSVKPTPNYGKPNLAPKPPGAVPGTNNKSNATSTPTATKGRPLVQRHQSMNTPRSPPVVPSGGIVFPTAATTTNHFGTMRGAPQVFQSQESINSNGNRPIGRPTVAPPPRPPPTKPPPPPIRSVSNTNLTNLPLSTAPSLAVNNNINSINNINNINNNNINNINNKQNFGSMKNVSNLKEQLKSKIVVNTGSFNNVSTLRSDNGGSGNNLNQLTIEKDSLKSTIQTTAPSSNGNGNVNIPPALPPHRTCPAPPPPTSRQVTNAIVCAPPVPPQRNSSMRVSAGHQLSNATIMQQQQTTNVSRLIIDLESKFNFRNVTGFPKPSPFMNVTKTYPSQQLVKSANGMSPSF